MRFRIETATPTKSADLKAALEAARDKWAQETEQSHTPGSPEHTALAEANNDFDQQRLMTKDEPSAKALVKTHNRLKDLVKAQSASPGPELVGAMELINQGIAGAVEIAAQHSCPVRVSVVGHFNLTAVAIHGGLKRLSVHVDDATYG